MFFSAMHQPGELSLLLQGARAVGTAGCLCALHFGDARHEYMQLVWGGRGLKINKHRELENIRLSFVSCQWLR